MKQPDEKIYWVDYRDLNIEEYVNAGDEQINRLIVDAGNKRFSVLLPPSLAVGDPLACLAVSCTTKPLDDPKLGLIWREKNEYILN